MYFLTNFYRFFPLSPERISAWRSELNQVAEKHHIKGLVVLAPDGINTTVASEHEASIQEFKNYLLAIPELKDLFFKDSKSTRRPFKRFKVDLRNEIVTLKTPAEDLPPTNPPGKLSPSEWHNVLVNESPDSYELIDVRNDYEIKLGTFEGAVSPHTDFFSQFPDYLDKFDAPKDKKLLICCTSGIRCERAFTEFSKRGYKNVHQLHGGIVKYMEEFPNQKFKGECFIFDHRVALKQDLTESDRYKLCPHCGNPGEEKITCDNCDEFAVICESCLGKIGVRACSKNCRHHLQMARKMTA